MISLLVVALAIFAVVSGWDKVRDERLPGELRVVNEGIAHGAAHWIFLRFFLIVDFVRRFPLVFQQPTFSVQNISYSNSN
jgi:hypothetical protein